MALPILGIISAVLPLFDKLIPDPQAAAKAKLDAMAMVQKGELAELDANLQVALAQIAVNTEDAKEKGLWGVLRAGWRPAVGWTCALAFFYSYVVLPFLLFGVYLYGDVATVAQIKQLPQLDLAAMLPVLFGMLGLGGMRSFEKVKA